MKKVTLILTAVIFSVAAVNATVVPTGDNNDTKEAKHNVYVGVPTVALIDVEDANGEESDITFTFNETDLVKEAGSRLDFSSLKNTDLYLQYTSIVSKKGASNQIQAKLIDNKLPDGMSLKVKASEDISGEAGKGTVGMGADEFQTLETNDAKTVVKGIGSCFTGTGGSYGHQLTYQLEMNDGDIASLFEGSYQTTVLYTITSGTSED